ncbi:BTB/POZ and TAZ domain-containing protein 1 [Apostasia shenzhenica]|uniref:BTB/POZ and TAZ domain-containing protein 1 n=1 Tax=Apostasia shenzhenica TaxID=1088818 RepID=A0A2I0AGI2_9ASPA|nr:BTB/POZ and TAZ domain-containing protein 1 [Apostasia shenzhenica]
MKQVLVPEPEFLRRWEEAVAANANATSAPPDVQILTSGLRRIPAHSRILASVSPVLESVMDRPAKRGNSEKVIPILGVPCDAVVAFLRFLYSGGRRWDVVEEEEMMERCGVQLLVLSHVYQVRWLKRACEEGLAARLTPEAVVDVLQLARQCDAAWLRVRCMKLIEKDFATVQKTEAWRFLQAHDPWLELDILQFIHETDLRQRRRRRKREEQRAYLQLSEAMECLVHISTEGCTDVGADRSCRRPCAAYASCRPIQLLLLHFASCGSNRATCPRCRRTWQLLRLHSAVCTALDQSSCRVPLCRCCVCVNL